MYKISDTIEFECDFTSGGPYQSLPSGSYSLRYNKTKTLSKGMSSRSDFIREHFDSINFKYAGQIAQFVLDGDREFTRHNVIENVTEIEDNNRCKINVKFYNKYNKIIRLPQVIHNSDYTSISCYSLYGWMHEKSDLYSNRIRINCSGILSVKSKLICRNLCFGFPRIRY